MKPGIGRDRGAIGRHAAGQRDQPAATAPATTSADGAGRSAAGARRAWPHPPRVPGSPRPWSARARCRQQPEERQGAREAARRQHGVAVLHQHHGVPDGCAPAARSPAAPGPARRACRCPGRAPGPAGRCGGGARRRNRSLTSRWSAISTMAATMVTGLRVARRLLDRGGEGGERGLGRDAVAGDDDEDLGRQQLGRRLRPVAGQPVGLRAPAREHAAPVPVASGTDAAAPSSSARRRSSRARR